MSLEYTVVKKRKSFNTIFGCHEEHNVTGIVIIGVSCYWIGPHSISVLFLLLYTAGALYIYAGSHNDL